MLFKLFTAFFVISFHSALLADKIGLLLMATGKYAEFVHPLVESGRQYFLPQHQVTYFVFTDHDLPPQVDVVYFYQEKLGWPFDTMMRFKVYLSQKELLARQDYLFASDVDMLFVDIVGDEILSERVATLSPGFTFGSPYPRERGDYETNSHSKAFVNDDEGEFYFAGGFYGGTAGEFLINAEVNAAHIDEDLKNDIIAKVHDESHLNRYFLDHPPTVILSPSYCYPENWNIPYKKRLLALDKDHQLFRGSQ